MAKICFSLLFAFVVWVWTGFSPLPLQAAPLLSSTTEAVLSPTLLSESDLPAGFKQVSVADIEGCQSQGDHGEVTAFVFQQAAMPRTSICLSAFVLTEKATNSSQATLMRQMMDTLLENPQALIEQAQTQSEVVADVKDVEVLQLTPVGEKAMGFAKQNGQQRDETLVFRRGDILASIAIHYEDATNPVVSLTQIATELDQRISRVVEQATTILQ